jgi:hypothetical protein
MGRVDEEIIFEVDDGGWNAEHERSAFGEPRCAERLKFERGRVRPPLGGERHDDIGLESFDAQPIGDIDLEERERAGREIRIEVYECLERRERRGRRRVQDRHVVASARPPGTVQGAAGSLVVKYSVLSVSLRATNINISFAKDDRSEGVKGVPMREEIDRE